MILPKIKKIREGGKVEKRLWAEDMKRVVNLGLILTQKA